MNTDPKPWSTGAAAAELTGTATGLFGLASTATSVNVLLIYFKRTVQLSILKK
jgi:hypothetical protein